MTANDARDPKREAFDRLGGRYEVRVLEPSPPAVTEPPWIADDPVATGEVPDGRTLVTPIAASGALTWLELCQKEERDDADLRAWCVARWLGPWRRLPADIPDYIATKSAWHALAEHILAPARYAANGKIGLRWTLDGIGTPYFGADHQLRLAATELLVDGEPNPVTTLRAAGEAAGISPGAPSTVYTATTPLDLDAPLEVDADAAAFLGGWFGLGCSALEELRAAARTEAAEPSRVQLWPEHFDLSVEVGDEASGRRATFGASPGDKDHPFPYLYVVPWSPQPTGLPWNEASFAGASLAYAELAGANDQRDAALAFFQTCSAAIEGGPS